MKPSLRAPYSPDPAPSHFYLFGYVRRCLAGKAQSQFLKWFKLFLTNTEKVTLQAAFLEWLDCLRKFIAPKGECTGEAKINVMDEYCFIVPVLRCS
jgi:hypothetical protein